MVCIDKVGKRNVAPLGLAVGGPLVEFGAGLNGLIVDAATRRKNVSNRGK